MGGKGGVVTGGVGLIIEEEEEDVSEASSSSPEAEGGMVGVRVRVGVGGAVCGGEEEAEEEDPFWEREKCTCVGLVPCECKKGNGIPDAEVRIGTDKEDKEGDFLELCMRRGGEGVGDSSSSREKMGEGEREMLCLRLGDGVRFVLSRKSSLLSFISRDRVIDWFVVSLGSILKGFGLLEGSIGEGSIQAMVVLRFPMAILVG